MLRILPLGGCGEIGMNMTVLQVDEHYYFIDGGSLFPDATLQGIDLIIPDVSFLQQNSIEPTAWLITHGHEDHIGALPWLFPKFKAPVHVSRFTRELVLEKVPGIDPHIRHWKTYETQAIGNIKVTPFLVNHSIPDALGLFIETPHGNILHTGDFRVDPSATHEGKTDDNIRRAVAGKTVLAMLSDSTNSLSAGSERTEASLDENFDAVFKSTAGTVIATTFASNIWRLKSLIEAAQRSNRRVYLLGRSLRRNVEIAGRLGLMNFDEDVFVPEEKLAYVRKAELLILCTGSQGEVTSGLNRVVANHLNSFTLQKGDTVLFSARAIPGNERNIAAMIEMALRRGADVVTSREMPVHASGHGFQEDLLACMRAAKPHYFMPVHGEYRHLLAHIALAQSAGIHRDNCFLVENGDWLQLHGDKVGVAEKIESGRDYICAGGPLSAKSEIYKQRMGLIRTGIFHAIYALDAEGYELLSQPTYTAIGVPVEVLSQLEDELKRIFTECFEGIERRKKVKDSDLKEEIRLGVRRWLERELNYKCKVVVVFQRLTPK